MLPLRFSWGIDFPSDFHNTRPLLLLKRRHRRHLHSYVSWWPTMGKSSFGKGCPFWKCKCWFFVSTQIIHKSLKHRLFPAFFVWWPNRVRVPNYPKYQLSRGLVDGSGGEYFSSIPSNNLLEGIRPLPTPKLFINKSLQWIRVEEVTRFKAHPKSWLHIAVNSSIQLGSEPGRNLWKYRWANNGWFRDLSHPKSRLFIGEWVHIMEKNHQITPWKSEQ